MNLKLIFAALLICSSVFAARAAEPAFKCADCHESTASVLPEKHEKVNGFADCFTCHYTEGNAAALGNAAHSKHAAGEEINTDLCFGCHGEKDGEFIINQKENITLDSDGMEDAAEKMNGFYKSEVLANSHKNADMTCLACHKSFDIDESEAMGSKCAECHGNYDAMAKQTEESKFIRNPHKHHYNTLDCTRCHTMHEEFKDYCAKCHTWNFTWQQKIKAD